MSQSIPIPITPPRPSSQNFSSSPHTSFSKTFPSNSSVPLHPQRATPSRTVSQILRSTLGHSVGGQGNGDDGEGSETMSVTSLISDVEVIYNHFQTSLALKFKQFSRKIMSG